MSAVIPTAVSRLFWDVERDSVDVERHRDWIIGRVLDWGNVDALVWLRRTYGDEALKRVATRGRGLARKTCVFWRTYFGLTGDSDVR
jgi:hypothetical protein